MKSLVVAALLAAGLAVGAAPSATAAPCSYFGPSEGSTSSKGICGTPNLPQSAGNAASNLRKNLTLTGNLNVGNLQHALTHGVGSAG